MNIARLLSLSAFVALLAAGCNTLPQTDEYTYWRKQPGSALYEPYTTDHPLTKAQQDELNVVAEKPKPDSVPAPEAK